jgi:O-antigen/teichoic acid export membrane protein
VVALEAQVLKQRMVSGVFWLAATKAAGQAVMWLVTIAVVRMLSPEDYGLMGMAVLCMGFLLLFNEFGLGAAIIQAADLKDPHVSDLRWAILLINVSLFLLLLPCAPLVAAYFREPELVAIVRALGLTFVINGIGAPAMYLLQREMQFKKKSAAELVGNVAGGLCTLVAAWLGRGVWSLVIGYLVMQFSMNVLYCAFRPIPIRWTFSPANIRQFVRFGIQVALSKVLWYASSNGDFIVVGRVLGTLQLGYYSLAFQFSSLPIEKVVSIITQVAFPSFAALQSDVATLRRYYLKLVGTVALITFPMFLGLLLVAESGVRLFLTDRWLPIVVPLQLLCAVSCLRAIETMNAPLLLAKGRPRIVVLNNLLQTIVLPTAFYVGTRYGLVGVAMAWVLAWPVLFAVVTSQTLRLVDLSWADYLRAISPAASAAAVMVGVVAAVQYFLLADADPLTQFAVTSSLGCITFLGYYGVFNRAGVREAIDTIARRGPAASAAQPMSAPRDTGYAPAPESGVSLDLERATRDASLIKAE